MMTGRQILAWVVALSLVAVAAAFLLRALRNQRERILRGAVIRQDTDPSKQVPISGTSVVAITGDSTAEAHSDQTGLFIINLPKDTHRGDPVYLRFYHQGYQPLQLNEVIGDHLYIARLIPGPAPVRNSDTARAEKVISNMRVRYVVRSTDVAEVGSEVKTFQVVSTGNVPCEKRPPCSPDGKWKAATASVSLDAGESNQFRNVRVSCIAGPCAFTRIDHQSLSADSRHLEVAAQAWSDTATILVEAEVVHPTEVDVVRESYPAIFGPSFSFSLPASSEGPSIEAEVNREAIVFPLGPDLSVTWAQCSEGKISERVTSYRCDLLPGYRFQ